MATDTPMMPPGQPVMAFPASNPAWVPPEPEAAGE